MSTKNKIIELLEQYKGKPLSGEEIAAFLGVSRAAVWKNINSLKQNGYDISATQNKGYVLNEQSDIISSESIKVRLNNKDIHVIYKESTTSTNDDLLNLAQQEQERTIVEVASMQKKGRGRLGRTFTSPKGGIYFSILINLKGVDIKDATIITPKAALAVRRAIKKICNKDLSIKWVNDLYLANKKVCGILTQANLDIETNTLSSVVVRIGLDYQIDLTKIDHQLKDIVRTIYDKNENAPSVSDVVSCVINEFMDLVSDVTSKDFYKEYKEHSFVLGKQIDFTYNNVLKTGKAIDIDENCALIVAINENETIILNSGEVSIKLTP